MRPSALSWLLIAALAVGFNGGRHAGLVACAIACSAAERRRGGAAVLQGVLIPCKAGCVVPAADAAPAGADRRARLAAARRPKAARRSPKRVSRRNGAADAVLAGAAAQNVTTYANLTAALAAVPSNTAKTFAAAAKAAQISDAILDVSAFTILIPTDAVSATGGGSRQRAPGRPPALQRQSPAVPLPRSGCPAAAAQPAGSRRRRPAATWSPCRQLHRRAAACPAHHPAPCCPCRRRSRPSSRASTPPPTPCWPSRTC
jgi:hypothetical protein